MKAVTVYLDFDGTVVEHVYPGLGRENLGWQYVCGKLVAAGHTIRLNTYRADLQAAAYKQGPDFLSTLRPDREEIDEFQVAKDYVNDPHHDLPPIEAEKQKAKPAAWPLRVEYARLHNRLYIDDQALGTPLLPGTVSDHWRVDWEQIDRDLEADGFYNAVDGPEMGVESANSL